MHVVPPATSDTLQTRMKRGTGHKKSAKEPQKQYGRLLRVQETLLRLPKSSNFELRTEMVPTVYSAVHLGFEHQRSLKLCLPKLRTALFLRCHTATCLQSPKACHCVHRVSTLTYFACVGGRMPEIRIAADKAMGLDEVNQEHPLLKARGEQVCLTVDLKPKFKIQLTVSCSWSLLNIWLPLVCMKNGSNMQYRSEQV